MNYFIAAAAVLLFITLVWWYEHELEKLRTENDRIKLGGAEYVANLEADIQDLVDEIKGWQIENDKLVETIGHLMVERLTLPSVLGGDETGDYQWPFNMIESEAIAADRAGVQRIHTLLEGQLELPLEDVCTDGFGQVIQFPAQLEGR